MSLLTHFARLRHNNYVAIDYWSLLLVCFVSLFECVLVSFDTFLTPYLHLLW